MWQRLALALLLLGACSSPESATPNILIDATDSVAQDVAEMPDDVAGEVAQPTDLVVPPDVADVAPDEVSPLDVLDAAELPDLAEDIHPDLPDVCVPGCEGLECGDDGCGGTCGNCPPGNECTDPGLCAPIVCDDDNDCLPDDLYCDVAGGNCVQCLADSHCAEDSHCQDFACLPGSCEPGEKLCSGNAVVTCFEGGAWGAPAPCLEKQEYCANGACHPVVCAPGSKTCDDNTIVMCADDGSAIEEELPCAAKQYCSNGNCYNQVCDPGELSCKDDISVLACNELGSAYNTIETCGLGEVCEDGACQGLPCGSLGFDGENDYLTIPHAPSLNAGQSFTLAFWFRTEKNAQDRLIVRKGPNEPGYWVWMKAPMYLKYGIYKGAIDYHINSPKTLLPGAWYHFAMTYDGASVTGYFDGAPDGVKAVTGGGAANANDDDLTVGYGYPDKFANAFFDGAMDDLVIYNKALTSDQVETLAEQGPWTDDSLVGYWAFDDFAGSSAADTSNNGLDGSVSGGAWLVDGWQCIEP